MPTTATVNAPPIQDATNKAGLRTRASRRSRLLRQVSLFAIASVALVLVALANRDAENVRNCRQRLDFVGQQLQLNYTRNQSLPPNLPMPGQTMDDPGVRDPLRRKPGSRDHYAYLGTTNLNHVGVVAVCACFSEHRLYLRDDGRHVVVFDPATAKFEVRWLTNAEFRQQAEKLGIGTMLAPAP